MKLVLHINSDSNTSIEELSNLTLQLKQDLLETDLPSIDLNRGGQLPDGAKAGDPIVWGSLLLTLSEAGGVISSMIGVIQSWINRHESSSITMEIDGSMIEIKGRATKQQSEIIAQWLSANTQNSN